MTRRDPISWTTVAAVAAVIALVLPAGAAGLANQVEAPGSPVRVDAPGFDAPSPEQLEGAKTLSDALRAARPSLPDAQPTAPGSLQAELGWWTQKLGAQPPGELPTLDPHVEEALAWILSGARQAETIRSAAAPLEGDSLAQARSLLLDGQLTEPPDASEPLDPAVRTLADQVDLDGLELAAATLAAATDRARSILSDRTPAETATSSCHADPNAPESIAGGLIQLDLVGEPTLYEAPALVSLDLGGCDTYTNDAGGGAAPGKPVGIALDLGSQPDRYIAPAESYSQGAGGIGIGLLLDEGGDDVYTATGYASQGAGIVGGVGLLADLSGDDRYEIDGAGGGFGGQGMGTIGVGALLDLGGDDEYIYRFDPGESAFGLRVLSAQGAGTVASLGVLADASGDDRYHASAVGNLAKVLAQGIGYFYGKGLLLDASGADGYEVAVDLTDQDGAAVGGAEGQGLGDFSGNGLLLDGGGPDTYLLHARGNGTLGAAIHAIGQATATGATRDPGTATLLDIDGDDAYEARVTARAEQPDDASALALSQGVGRFEGTAVLEDVRGNDTYRQTLDAPGDTEGYAQGAGLGLGVGALVDGAGDDIYIAGPTSQGYGTSYDLGGPRLPGGTGVLVDGGGNDTMSGPGEGRAFWMQGDEGVGLGVSGGGGEEMARDLRRFLLPGFELP